MQQFLEADDKREKKIEVNMEHLEDFNEAAAVGGRQRSGIEEEGRRGTGGRSKEL